MFRNIATASLLSLLLPGAADFTSAVGAKTSPAAASVKLFSDDFSSYPEGQIGLRTEAQSRFTAVKVTTTPAESERLAALATVLGGTLGPGAAGHAEGQGHPHHHPPGHAGLPARPGRERRRGSGGAQRGSGDHVRRFLLGQQGCYFSSHSTAEASFCAASPVKRGRVHRPWRQRDTRQ